MEVEASAERGASPEAPLNPEPPGEPIAQALPSSPHSTAGASAGLGVVRTPRGRLAAAATQPWHTTGLTPTPTLGWEGTPVPQRGAGSQ